MISRFFKKKKAPEKKAAVKKKVAPKPAPKTAKQPRKVKEVAMKASKKILTAEGWRRLMMKKTKASKK